MNLPEPPSTFRQPALSDRPWWWRLEDASGAEVELVGEVAETFGDKRFPNQADAESWIGEIWSTLKEAGVEQVTLLELDRVVYGPMSLSA